MENKEEQMVKEVANLLSSTMASPRKEYIDVLEVEEKMLQAKQAEADVVHIFLGGVYIRQCFLPAGMLVVGKRHRHKTCNILLEGRVIVYAMNGETIEYVAPCIFESESFVKKLVYTLEDTIFTNIHPTALTDLKEIEKEFIISEEEYEAFIRGGM